MAARIAELSRATAVQARQIARGLNPVNLGTMGLVAALEEIEHRRLAIETLVNAGLLTCCLADQ